MKEQLSEGRIKQFVKRVFQDMLDKDDSRRGGESKEDYIDRMRKEDPELDKAYRDLKDVQDRIERNIEKNRSKTYDL